LAKFNKKKNFLEYVSRFANINIMLIFRYISIAGTSHFLFEEGLDVIQKTFQAYLTGEKIREVLHGRELAGNNNLPIRDTDS
jgi:hypothetical protein